MIEVEIYRMESKRCNCKSAYYCDLFLGYGIQGLVGEPELNSIFCSIVEELLDPNLNYKGNEFIVFRQRHYYEKFKKFICGNNTARWWWKSELEEVGKIVCRSGHYELNPDWVNKKTVQNRRVLKEYSRKAIAFSLNPVRANVHYWLINFFEQIIEEKREESLKVFFEIEKELSNRKCKSYTEKQFNRAYELAKNKIENL